MIIDSHTHLGSTVLFDEDVTEMDLLVAMDENGIDVTIVQPFPGAPSPVAVHDRIAKLADENPGRIFGMVSTPPVPDVRNFREEATRCVQELGFVAIKLHTVGHPVLPTSTAGMAVFETAAGLGVPLMVHTGLGLPFASPSLVIPGAREFPDLPVILAHAGYAITSMEALVVAQVCPNILLEPSWTPSKLTLGMIRQVGADRVMFGSDLTINIPTELTKIRSIGLQPTELDQVLARTANSVFQLGLGMAPSDTGDKQEHVEEEPHD